MQIVMLPSGMPKVAAPVPSYGSVLFYSPTQSNGLTLTAAFPTPSHIRPSYNKYGFKFGDLCHVSTPSFLGWSHLVAHR